MDKKSRIINRLYEINKLEFEESEEFISIVSAIMEYNQINWNDFGEMKECLLEQLVEENNFRLRRLSAMEYQEAVSDICDNSDEWNNWSKFDSSEEAFKEISNVLSMDKQTFTNLCETFIDFSNC